MEEQRAAGAHPAPPPPTAPRTRHEARPRLRRRGAADRFVGYETLRATTGLAAVEADDGRALVKLEESPFYAEGGGQVADSGVLRWNGGGGAGRRRLPGRRRPGARGRAERAAIEPGVAGRGRGRSRDAPRDDAQPHRDPPPARGAARAARHPRPPGRLRGPPRQAALRLHPRPGARPRGAARRSRTASTSGSRRAGRCAG